jgi:hypothetical protein
MAQRQQALAEQELKLWEKEEQGDLRLDRELEALTLHESNLNNCEATLAAEQKDLEETHVGVLARELTIDIRDLRRNSREEELVDREKRLVEREQQLVGRQLQDVAATRSRLEELLVARVGKAQKVWDFLGQAEAALVPP